MRRGLAVVLVLLLAAGGYAGLDIEDRVPGILTLDPPPDRAASPASLAPAAAAERGPPAGAVPLAEASPALPLPVAGTQAPLPAGPALATVLAPRAGRPRPGPLRRRDGPRRGDRGAPARPQRRPARHPGLHDQAAHRHRGHGHDGPASCG